MLSAQIIYRYLKTIKKWKMKAIHHKKDKIVAEDEMKFRDPWNSTRKNGYTSFVQRAHICGY